MSKVEKTIQAAQEWRKRHGAEALDFKGLDGSLAQWETSVLKVTAAKTTTSVNLAWTAALEGRRVPRASLPASPRSWGILGRKGRP